MVKKYIMFDMNDSASEKVAEILGNKTCKKILGLLAERDGEMSVGDISKELHLAINTVDYNVKKLVESSLIDKSSSFFWSVKGKKIPTYKIANKHIVISTKTSFRGVLVSALFGGLALGAIKTFMNYKITNNLEGTILENMPLDSYSAVPKIAASSDSFMQTTTYFQNVWIWSLLGLVLGVVCFLLYKRMKGGFNK